MMLKKGGRSLCIGGAMVLKKGGRVGSNVAESLFSPTEVSEDAGASEMLYFM